MKKRDSSLKKYILTAFRMAFAVSFALDSLSISCVIVILKSMFWLANFSRLLLSIKLQGSDISVAKSLSDTLVLDDAGYELTG